MGLENEIWFWNPPDSVISPSVLLPVSAETGSGIIWDQTTDMSMLFGSFLNCNMEKQKKWVEVCYHP